MAETTPVKADLVGIWSINNRVNLRLLDALTDEQLAATILPRGKTVASHFAHLHMARYHWLKRRGGALAKGFRKIVGGGTAPRAILRRALIESGDAMAQLFAQAQLTGQLKGTKLGAMGFLGYTLAHEAHHRGQIILHLKVAKLPLNRVTGYSLWYWNTI